MVTIRLSRGGSKKRPFYSILVADQRRSARGRFIERVGFYNPVAAGREKKLRIDTDRIDHWINQGAQPSERVTQLYKQAKTAAKPKTAKPAKAEKSTESAESAGATKPAEAAEAVEAVKPEEVEKSVEPKPEPAEAEKPAKAAKAAKPAKPAKSAKPEDS